MGCEHFAAVLCYEDVIFNAHADVAILLGYILQVTDVDAGLDSENHSWLEPPRISVRLIFSYIMHIGSDPVAGAVHIKLPIRSLFHHTRLLSLYKSKPQQSINYD